MKLTLTLSLTLALALTLRVSAEVEKEFISMKASSTPYLARGWALVRARVSVVVRASGTVEVSLIPTP